MSRIKFFYAQNASILEQHVNNFIKDKQVINISYSIDGRFDYCHHSCCVLYSE